MGSDCRSFCATTPQFCISPGLPGFVHRLYIPGYGWIPWELASGMASGDDRACTTVPPPSGGAVVRISRHHAASMTSPWFPRTLPPINIPHEDDCSWEFPSSPPGTRRGVPLLIFVHMLHLAYIIYIFLVSSESVPTNSAK